MRKRLLKKILNIFFGAIAMGNVLDFYSFLEILRLCYEISCTIFGVTYFL
jgi:hypothetical protein